MRKSTYAAGACIVYSTAWRQILLAHAAHIRPHAGLLLSIATALMYSPGCSVRTWRCCSCWSSFSWRLMTSRRVAGVLDTCCTHSWPSCVHSRGGRMLFRMSSVCVSPLFSTGGSDCKKHGCQLHLADSGVGSMQVQPAIPLAGTSQMACTLSSWIAACRSPPTSMTG